MHHRYGGTLMTALKSLALFLLLAAVVPAAAEDLFDVKPVADGVWAAIAKPHRPENANSAVIELDRGLLVVDAASTPSSARGLISQVRKLTPKPVVWIVNTHYHWDHYWGNEAFVEAWPHVRIVSSEATRRDMQSAELGNAQLETWKKEIPSLIEKWKAALPKATDAAERAKLQDRIVKWGAAVEEFKQMRLVLPGVTFEKELILRDPRRRVQILWLGGAHTPGDVVVYLPESRVLVSGDMLAGDTPYIGAVSPTEWVATLNKVGRLDFDTVIPGHGDVEHGKTHLELWKRYLTDLMTETSRAFARGESLAAATKSVVPILKARYADKFPEGFSYAVEGNVEAAYGFISKKQN